MINIKASLILLLQTMQASTHQGDSLFFASGRQCTSNVASCFIQTLRQPIDIWETSTLDAILTNGDLLYSEWTQRLQEKTYFSVEELPFNIGHCQFHYNSPKHGSILQTTEGTELGHSDLFSLTDILEHHWNTNYAFLTVGQEVPSYTTGIFKNVMGDKFFHFDSHSRGRDGLCIPNGKATLTSHQSLKALSSFIVKLVSSLGMIEPPFEFTPVTVSASTPVSAVDLDISTLITVEVIDDDEDCLISSALDDYYTSIAHNYEFNLNTSNFDDTDICYDIPVMESEVTVPSQLLLDSQDADNIHNGVNLHEPATGTSIVGLPSGDPSTKEAQTCDDVPVFESDVPSQPPPNSQDTENIHDEAQQSDDTSAKESQRGRKRKRNPENWKRNIAKARRNEGVSYMNTTGKETAAREMKNGCGMNCKYKCHEKVTYKKREEIFHAYWALGDIQEQRAYIRRMVRTQPTQRCRSERSESSTKNKSRIWSFTLGAQTFRVCKTFFLQTLDISAKFSTFALDGVSTSTGVQKKDSRGKHNNRRSRISEEEKSFIRTHINSFPRVDSHYCRRDSRRQYLGGHLSISKLYHEYILKCKDVVKVPVSKFVYTEVFDEYNLGFHKPKKDLCDLCTTYTQTPANERSDELIERYENHQKNKKLARENKENDKIRAQNDEIHVACFDLEQILLTPHITLH